MRKHIITLLLVLITSISSIAFSGLLPAKYAGAFMRTGVGARPLGIGGAYVAAVEDVTAIYWNPAGLAWMKTLQVHGMHAERFAGIVNWDFVGAGLLLENSLAFGFGFFRLGVDGIPFTDIKDPSHELGEIYFDDSGKRVQNVPFAYKYVNDTEMAFIFSVAKRRSTDFSYGGNVKVVRKSMGGYGAWGIGFDFGILLTPYRSMKVGLVLLDGTSTLIAWNGGRRELITPHLKAGIAYPMSISMFEVLPVLDIHMTFENRGSAAQVALGRLDLDFRGGVEVGFKNRIAMRIGSDRGHLTAGAGIQAIGFGIDYGFSHHFELGNTHRISVTLSWDKKHI